MEQIMSVGATSQHLQSLLEALHKLTILGHSTINEHTLHLTLNILNMDEYDTIAPKLRSTSDVELLLDFVLDLLRDGGLTNSGIHGANQKARMLLFKLISMTEVIPRSLFVTNITDLESISVGGFGRVFEGLYEGKPVAVKMLYHACHEGSLRKDFCREALVWRSLSHRYILPLLGIFEERSQLFLVSPFMANGTLTQWRRNKRPGVGDIHRLMVEVAEAIQYLHSEGIVHGDLHGRNVLLDPEFHCQITDFGLTRHSEATVTRSTTTLTLNFAAPELFGVCANCGLFECNGCQGDYDVQHRSKTMKTDVYAFGCLYYAIFFDNVPFQGKNDFQVTRFITSGMRPERLENPRMGDNTWNLIESCWKSNPAGRPTMEQIVCKLPAGITNWLRPLGDLHPFPSRSHLGSDGGTPSGPVSSAQIYPVPTRETELPLGHYMGATYVPSPSRFRFEAKALTHMPVPSANTFGGVQEGDGQYGSDGVMNGISQPVIVIDHSSLPSSLPSRVTTPDRIMPITSRYRGWLSEVVKPLEEFIDEAIDPRVYYIDLQEIAEGESGSVFAAQIANYVDLTKLQLDPSLIQRDRETLDSGGPVTIAIKNVTILPSGSPKLLELEKELKLMKGLSHENILSMDALYVDLVEDSLWIRMELMERSLADVVSLVDSGLMLLDRMIARFASDVLQALRFLQRHNIAHRDVRSNNLMLNLHGVLKLADFSTAVQVLPSSPMQSDVVGVSYWQAPEVRTPPYNALKVDVWSLGATVWEVAEAEAPFSTSRELSDRWPPLSKSNSTLFSRAFHDFLRQCSEPAVLRPGPETLCSHPFVMDACGRSVIVELLSQNMTSPHIPQSIEGTLLAQSMHAQKNESLQSSPPPPYRGRLSEAYSDGDHLRKDRHFAMPTHTEHAPYTHVPSLYSNNHPRDDASHSQASNKKREDLRLLAPPRVYSLPSGAPPLPSPPVPRSPSLDDSLPLPNKPASTEDSKQSTHIQKKTSHQNAPTRFLRALYTAVQGGTNGNRGSQAVLEERSQVSETDKGESDKGLIDKKERRGFWETGKDKRKERWKEHDQKDDSELTRMIGFLTATASEDWALVLEVCDRASANTKNAKEAVRALRREFKYNEPLAQLSTARLWAIMWRNCSEVFVGETASRDFLITLEESITSSRTSPVVRERLLDVVGAAAYNSPKDSGFRSLWKRVKPADKPEEGVPFDIDDATINPLTSRHSQNDIPEVILPEEDTREKDQKDDSGLTRMIGFLTATASEDWALVLEVCDRASANTENAKEAVRALRREFRYGGPPAQLSAARLWAIMWRNCSEVFVAETASRKFLITLEELITSSRTSPVVRERLLDVVGAAAYNSPKDSGFRSLWKKVKPRDKPEEGVPFDIDDAIINPPTGPRHSQNDIPRQHPLSIPVPNTSRKRNSPTRGRIIPSEDDDIRRLLQECLIGTGNAALLSDALAACKPERLESNPVVREFYAKCRSSEELIFAQIPWARAGAERSRAARSQLLQTGQRLPDGDGQTTEEKLLGRLLNADEELQFVLKQCEDLTVERRTEDTSGKQTRMDPRDTKPWHGSDYLQGLTNERAEIIQ